MNKFIIASCIIALTFGFTANPSNHCSCNSYHLQTECTGAAGFGCFWNTTGTATCQNVNCAGLAVADCPAYSSSCAVVNNACVSFSSCGSLKGNTAANCTGQNAGCTWTSGESCVTWACTLYKDQASCPASCLWTSSGCSAVTSCSSLNTTTCANYGCLVNGNTCQSYVCSNFTAAGAAACITSASSATSLTPCFWNSTACVDASLSNLTSTTCFISTGGAYHWSSSSTTDGSCQSCYGLLIQIVFALILLLA